MIELKSISKWVNIGAARNFILKDINLQNQRRRIYIDHGPVRSVNPVCWIIIGMLDEASEGSYYFMDNDVFKLREKTTVRNYINRISVLYSSISPDWWVNGIRKYWDPADLPGYQNIGAQSHRCRYIDRVPDRREKRSFPTQLSGGQQQFGRHWRGAGGKTQTDIADEPTGNLNPNKAKKSWSYSKN